MGAKKITKKTSKRYLGIDISLSSPGAAVIDVIDGKPRLVAHDHVKTGAKTIDGLRFTLVESFITLFAAQHIGDTSYAAIIREDYKRPQSKRQGQTIFGAWAAVDIGLNHHGLTVTDEINAAEVKRLIGGHGRAEKGEVAAGVRRILRLPKDYVFPTDDESDACAIVLAWLISKGVIDP